MKRRRAPRRRRVGWAEGSRKRWLDDDDDELVLIAAWWDWLGAFLLVGLVTELVTERLPDTQLGAALRVLREGNEPAPRG